MTTEYRKKLDAAVKARLMRPGPDEMTALSHNIVDIIADHLIEHGPSGVMTDAGVKANHGYTSGERVDTAFTAMLRALKEDE